MTNMNTHSYRPGEQQDIIQRMEERVAALEEQHRALKAECSSLRQEHNDFVQDVLVILDPPKARKMFVLSSERF